MSSSIDRQIAILRHLGNRGKKTTLEIIRHLEEEIFPGEFLSGTVHAELNTLESQEWVKIVGVRKEVKPKLFGEGEKEVEERLYDVDRNKGNWPERVRELSKAKERLGPGREGLGGLSPA